MTSLIKYSEFEQQFFNCLCQPSRCRRYFDESTTQIKLDECINRIIKIVNTSNDAGQKNIFELCFEFSGGTGLCPINRVTLLDALIAMKKYDIVKHILPNCNLILLNGGSGSESPPLKSILRSQGNLDGLEIAEMLLEKGADVNAILQNFTWDKNVNLTPLWFAAEMYEDPYMTDLYIRKGGKVCHELPEAAKTVVLSIIRNKYDAPGVFDKFKIINYLAKIYASQDLAKILTSRYIDVVLNSPYKKPLLPSDESKFDLIESVKLQFEKLGDKFSKLDLSFLDKAEANPCVLQ